MGPFALLGVGVVAASVAAEVIFADAAHAELLWHRWPGFDFVFGLAGSALLVVLSKWLGYRFLYRPEDYYQDERSAE
jgi:hypothetical protein